jgi:hypothetical protein
VVVYQRYQEKNPILNPREGNTMPVQLYTPIIVDQILTQLKAGKQLPQICNEPGMPKAGTVQRWTLTYPEFKVKYLKAREGHKHLGAPTVKYDQAIVDEILDRIGQGETLTTIVKDKHIPGLGTIYQWRRQYPAFLEAYTRARQDQADSYADRMNNLADQCREELKDLPDPRLSNAWKETYRMELDALKWTSSKLKPQLYGDKAMVDINSQVKVLKPDSMKKNKKKAGIGVKRSSKAPKKVNK